MQYKSLGQSDLKVSEIGLGTMTFGQQNTLEEAHQQLDFAIAQGINWIDTAEMYPVPARAETQGATEEYVGRWLINQPRDRLIIATKIAGPGRRLQWIREGPRCLDRRNILQAVEGSLKRLQTDYIDLYQIHWPDRYVPLFGQTEFDQRQERDTIPIAEQLEVFAELIQAGKIRYVGVSNETPWGVLEFCHRAEQMNLPKIVSIQNAYNLINRHFDAALAEVCHRENVGVLAYSPLGFGVLTGKYLDNSSQPGRITLFPGFGGRYHKLNVAAAVQEYKTIAQRYHLSPAVLAIAFVRSRWFITSTLIGATHLDQLKENLESLQVTLTSDILKDIEAVHLRYPNPAP